MKTKMSALANRVTHSEIRELLKWTRMPDVISFAGGLPDPCLFPIEELAVITERVLRKKGYLALQYGPTQGEAEMIEALKGHMDSYGETVRSEEILVSASSQQGLDLLSLLFIDAGSPVIVELPSYIGALQAFSRSGADLRGVVMDAEGINLEALERCLGELSREGKTPRFVYVIPDFQNPSGVNMSLQRRKDLIELARKWGFLIVEDSPYRELIFTGEMLPSLWTLSGGDGVILLKTFSKMLFPGMRLGWIAAKAPWLEKLVMIKQSVDLCTASFTQFIVADYIVSGKMRATIARAIDCYRPKRNAMVAALEAGMPPGSQWSRPYGGMFLWAEFPPGIASADVFARTAPRGVVFVQGRQFLCDGSGAETMRLNFSFQSVDRIDRGIEIIAAAAHEVINETRSAAQNV